jgi:hypothetical protein
MLMRTLADWSGPPVDRPHEQITRARDCLIGRKVRLHNRSNFGVSILAGDDSETGSVRSRCISEYHECHHDMRLAVGRAGRPQALAVAFLFDCVTTTL